MNTTHTPRLDRLLAGLAIAGACAVAQAAPIYADTATAVNVSFFGSGLLTGAQDGGGAFLSNTSDPPTLLGSITAGFSGGITDGAGVDLTIFDCCAGGTPTAGETADVFVSTDGVGFTLIGAYGVGGTNTFDFNGVFAGDVYFVRIVNTSTSNSPDIDAFMGNYAATGSVPVPGSLALAGLGLLALGALNRRR